MRTLALVLACLTSPVTTSTRYSCSSRLALQLSWISTCQRSKPLAHHRHQRSGARPSAMPWHVRPGVRKGEATDAGRLPGATARLRWPARRL